MSKIDNIDEIIKQRKAAFYILMKFGSKENLERIQNGQVYMKNLDYYINLEKETTDENIGDMFDGQMPIHDVNISMYNPETNELIYQFKSDMATMNLGFKKSPVLCMFILDQRNFISSNVNEDLLSFRFTFTEEQKEKLAKFGDSVLLIKNPEEFFNRMEAGLVADGINFTRDRVKYYEKNIMQHFQDVTDDYKRIAFWKRKKYEHQQEYRYLIFNRSVEDHYTLSIKDLTDISEIVTIDTIFNTEVEVRYKIELENE
jgi:hypothetical protein